MNKYVVKIGFPLSDGYSVEAMGPQEAALKAVQREESGRIIEGNDPRDSIQTKVWVEGWGCSGGVFAVQYRESRWSVWMVV